MEPIPPLVFRRQALATGYTDAELNRMRRRGELVALVRGAYVKGGDLPGEAAVRHRLQVTACSDRLRLDAVISHQSAAAMLGIELWSVPLERVHLTREPPAWGHRSRDLLCHAAAIAAEEIVVVDDLMVTSPARTVLDLARSLPFEQAVVAADSALHQKLLTPADLSDVLAVFAGTPGCRAAERVVAFADGRSESVGESRSRVLIAQAGLPAPDLQYEVWDQLGHLIARCDFGWAEQRVVGEFDGRVKYGRLLRPGQTPQSTVYAEKLREDGIRGEDLGVARWTWSDLRPEILRAKIRRAFDISRRRSSSGVELP